MTLLESPSRLLELNPALTIDHATNMTFVEHWLKRIVLRLRKMQIRNSFGQEETAIAAFHVSDGIDQCHVGFLPCHFVPHAPASFDGVLVQVTEIYSPTSKSVSKRKKFRQAAIGFVGRFEDNNYRPVTAIATARATATATRSFAEQRRSEHAAAARPKECITPTAITNKVAAKKKTSNGGCPPSSSVGVGPKPAPYYSRRNYLGFTCFYNLKIIGEHGTSISIVVKHRKIKKVVTHFRQQ